MSWNSTAEANSRLACQETLCNLWNSKDRYFVHNNPLLDHDLSQLNSFSHSTSLTYILISPSDISLCFQSVFSYVSCITAFITLFVNNVIYYHYHKRFESSHGMP
jgi:hypothetical protein